MDKMTSDISPQSLDALLERVADIERSFAAVCADNSQMAADNSRMAAELEAMRAETARLAAELEAERATSAARTEAAVAAAQAEMRADLDRAKAERDRALAERDDATARADRADADNARLAEQIMLLNQRFFGAKSERVKHVVPGQLSLFNDFEADAEENVEPVPDTAPKSVKRRRRGGKRVIDMSRLETVVVDHDLAPEGHACPQCGSGLVEINVEVTRKLRMVPAHLVCEEHRTHVYACRECNGANAAGEEVASVIVRAPRPEEAFPKSVATPSLVSWVIAQKYVYALPLYRIERGLGDLGARVSRADMSNWVIRAFEWWLRYIRDGIRAYIKTRSVIHADETPVQVLKEPDRKAESKSYCWLFCSPWCDHPAYDYVYAPTRSGCVAAGYLEGWSGALVTDGYDPYFDLGPSVTNIACLAHIRRRFAELVKLAGGDEKAAEAAGDSSLALDGRRLIDRIFHAENRIGDVTPRERAAARQSEVASAMDRFVTWCEAMLPHATPGLRLERDMGYALKFMPFVRNAVDVGEAELTNNRAERSVKPFVIGRKNWLFSNTPRGAEASCGLYSIVTTARENGLSPMPYVEWLLEELPQAGDLSDPEVVGRYLPWGDLVPERLRIDVSEVEKLRAVQEEPIADIDPGSLREDE